MVALRIRPTAALSRSFWLTALCAALMPTSVGYQDLAALFARQPGVSERWREHLIASPFGTIHAATFSFSRPIGTAMPEPLAVRLANFDPRSLGPKAWTTAVTPPALRPAQHVEYPTVNRRLKGDRAPLPQRAPDASEPEGAPVEPINAPAALPARPTPLLAPRPKDAEQPAPASSQDWEADEDSVMADSPAKTIADGEDASHQAASSPLAALAVLDEDADERDTQLYFGVATLGANGGLEQWAPGAAPVPVAPAADRQITLSALSVAAGAGVSGETLVGKGNAAGFKSPAERLGLFGKPRARAEKCIADAVYFEARGEPLRGQMAVAQVVMNRVFSGRYPSDVCGVVYQNANRHLACQFTFACEGKDLSRIDEPDMWAQARRIAKDALDGKIWLTEVGHATHYHAYWVHPSWVHEMAKLYRLGVHTFYRPLAWGDGSDAPIWSNVQAALRAVGAAVQNREQNREAAKVPAAAIKRSLRTAKAPRPSASRKTRTAAL